MYPSLWFLMTIMTWETIVVADLEKRILLNICVVVDMKKYCLSFFPMTFAEVSGGFAVIDLRQHAANVLIIISCIILEILLTYVYLPW